MGPSRRPPASPGEDPCNVLVTGEFAGKPVHPPRRPVGVPAWREPGTLSDCATAPNLDRLASIDPDILDDVQCAIAQKLGPVKLLESIVATWRLIEAAFGPDPDPVAAGRPPRLTGRRRHGLMAVLHERGWLHGFKLRRPAPASDAQDAS